ncbi:putative transcription factor, K-box [Helianthus annuus]|nr:putative transcription factor, K-box [Helianthus annuus]
MDAVKAIEMVGSGSRASSVGIGLMVESEVVVKSIVNNGGRVSSCLGWMKWHYMGEDIESLSLKEIQNLEQQLDTGLKNIRTRKNQLLHESISELQKKGKAIQEQNTTLTKKIKEKEKDKTIPQNTQWEMHNYVDHDTTFLMPPPPPALNMGGDYNHGGGGSSEGADGRTNELDLSLQPIYSCHMRCFPS